MIGATMGIDYPTLDLGYYHLEQNPLRIMVTRGA